MWLNGFERVDNLRSAGGAIRRPERPPRIVLHTTEVPTADLRRLAARHDWPPHVWADPRTRVRLQTVDLHRSAYALRAATGIETNHMGRCAQVELHLRAADTPWLTGDDLEWIGREVVAPIARAIGLTGPFDTWTPTLGVEAYGTNGPARMTQVEWSEFRGLTTHQAVPQNSHWDAGAIDLDRIARAARAELAPSSTPPPGAAPVTDSLTRASFLTVIAHLTGVDQSRLIAGGVNAEPLPRLATADQLADVERRLHASVTSIRPGATGPEVAQTVADEVDRIVAALDGLDLDGRTITGDDVRQLLLELLGATDPA